MFWIGGGRLQEMVAQGGSTLLFSLLCTYIASQLEGHSAPVRMEWHERSLQEKHLEESVREVTNGKLAKELQSAKGLEKLSVITGARWGHSIVWSVYKVDNPGPVSRKAQKHFGPKANFRIKTCWIVAQFLAKKPDSLLQSLTDSFTVPFSKLKANTKQLSGPEKLSELSSDP